MNYTHYQLVSYNQVIEAAQLLIEAEDWRILVALINTQAQSFFHKGQFQTVAHWLKQIPEQLVKAEPWLLYWSGMCLILQNPETGRKFFKQSLAGFEKTRISQDFIWQPVAWVSAWGVDSILL